MLYYFLFFALPVALIFQQSAAGNFILQVWNKTAQTIPQWHDDIHQQLGAFSAWPERDTSRLCTEIFIKIHKCGSSTNGGVARAIAANRNLSGVNDVDEGVSCRKGRFSIQEEGCKVHANHAPAKVLRACRVERGGWLSNGSWVDEDEFGDISQLLNELPILASRARPRSLLWTVVRDPVTRALSWYYYMHVKCKAHKNCTQPPDEDVIKRISKISGSYIFNYMDGLTTEKNVCRSGEDVDKSGRNKTHPFGWNHSIVECEVKHLLDSYDFVGVMEREDESLVAMKLLFGLRFRDILYVSAKVRSESGLLIPNPGNQLQTFLKGEFRTKCYVDRVLHAAANAKLDATIAGYGTVYDDELTRYTSLLVSARVACGDVIKQRSRDPSLCSWNDARCGNECLDAFAAEYVMG
jgi:hypothetical protein